MSASLVDFLHALASSRQLNSRQLTSALVDFDALTGLTHLGANPHAGGCCDSCWNNRSCSHSCSRSLTKKENGSCNSRKTAGKQQDIFHDGTLATLKLHLVLFHSVLRQDEVVDELLILRDQELRPEHQLCKFNL